jgi:hypothetical protein
MCPFWRKLEVSTPVTDQEINNLSPEAINEAVARKLGYSQCSSGEPPYPHWHNKEHSEKFTSKEWIDMCVCHSDLKYFNASDLCRQLPNFCEDIEAAWEIVGILRQQGFQVSIFMMQRYARCEIGPHEKPLYSESADTAPMAICLAFLKLP